MSRSMEEVGRSEWRKLLQEKERERRRLRDRQRRQSMSVEEREKHLARRRRNYQLRRLRSRNARLEPQSEQPTVINQFPALASASDLGGRCNDAVSHVESRQGEGNLNADSRESESLQIPVHKLANYSGQLRLNHLKHLARSLNGSASLYDGDGVAAGAMIKGSEASVDHCADISQKNLRLNGIKRLARSLNSAVKETTSHNNMRQIYDSQCS